MVLVERSEHRRDDPLTERVIERVVDDRGLNTVTRCDIALDRYIQSRPGIELVGRDIGDARYPLDLAYKKSCPMVEFAGPRRSRCTDIGSWDTRPPIVMSCAACM